MTNRTFSFAILLFFLVSPAAAQRVVNGSVIDTESLDALSYAHITAISEHFLGTVTNTDGLFTLILADDVDSLNISYLGNKSKIVAINNHTGNLIVKMIPDAVILDEVTIRPLDPLGLIRSAIAVMTDMMFTL